MASQNRGLTIEERRVLVAGDMPSDVLIPLLDLNDTADPLENYLVALRLLEGVAGDVDVVIPGHGSIGKWIDSECIDIADPNDEKTYKITTDFQSPEYRERAVVDTFENLLYRYLQHPEANRFAPDNGPYKPDTRGLLQPAHIVAG